jgi:hypothetical protein
MMLDPPYDTRVVLRAFLDGAAQAHCRGCTRPRASTQRRQPVALAPPSAAHTGSLRRVGHVTDAASSLLAERTVGLLLLWHGNRDQSFGPFGLIGEQSGGGVRPVRHTAPQINPTSTAAPFLIVGGGKQEAAN